MTTEPSNNVAGVCHGGRDIADVITVSGDRPTRDALYLILRSCGLYRTGDRAIGHFVRRIGGTADCLRDWCRLSFTPNDIGLCRGPTAKCTLDVSMLRQVTRSLTKESRMDEYTWRSMIGPGFRYFACITRNALVRRSDRLESAARLIAVVVTLAAIAPAAAFGTSVLTQQSQVALQQATDRHTVSATAMAGSVIEARIAAVRFWSPVRWMANDVVHNAWIEGTDDLKSGDLTTVWVNDRGELAGPPLTHEQVSANAFGAGVLLWLSIVGGMCLVIQVLRWRLDRTRYADWSNEWQALDCDGEGKQGHRRA